MYKVIALLKKKAGMTHEAFIDYYEKHHAPFILKTMPGIVEYRRNFLDPNMIVHAGGAAPDFDVITELWFIDRASFKSAMSVFDNPQTFASLAADEENLFDRSMTRFIAAEERISNIY